MRRYEKTGGLANQDKNCSLEVRVLFKDILCHLGIVFSSMEGE